MAAAATLRSAARQSTSSLLTPGEPQPPGAGSVSTAEADDTQGGEGVGAPRGRPGPQSRPLGGWPEGWNRMTREEKLAYVRRRLESLEQRAADKSPLERASPGLPVGEAKVQTEMPVTISASSASVVCVLGHTSPALTSGHLGFVEEATGRATPSHETQQGNAGACADCHTDEYTTGPCKDPPGPASTPGTRHGDVAATHPAAGVPYVSQFKFAKLPRIHRKGCALQEMDNILEIGSNAQK
jgi:hypothetical protein